MITCIVGTPGSGKSQLAESLVETLGKERKKYYIATLVPFGEAGKKRVEKHQSMRQGKGFITLEWPYDLAVRQQEIMNFSTSVVLLECMSNLIGNEMYHPANRDLSQEQLCAKLIAEVKALGDRAVHLVVVTNEFPLEEAQYDEATRSYVRLVAAVNAELDKLADTVYVHRNGAWIRYENH